MSRKCSDLKGVQLLISNLIGEPGKVKTALFGNDCRIVLDYWISNNEKCGSEVLTTLIERLLGGRLGQKRRLVEIQNKG